MHHTYMIKITYTPPYMLYSYTKSKQKHVSHTYAMLLHWELAQTLLPPLHKHAFTSLHKIKTPCIQDLSPFSIQVWKGTWAICYEERERVKKRELEKMIKNRWVKKVSSKKQKRMSLKDSPWSQSSRFGERIFKESTFNSYPHTCTLDHVCMLFSSMDPCFDFTI